MALDFDGREQQFYRVSQNSGNRLWPFIRDWLSRGVRWMAVKWDCFVRDKRMHWWWIELPSPPNKSSDYSAVRDKCDCSSSIMKNQRRRSNVNGRCMRMVSGGIRFWLAGNFCDTRKQHGHFLAYHFNKPNGFNHSKPKLKRLWPIFITHNM